MSADVRLRPHTVYQRQQVDGADVSWDQPVKILPVDPVVREAILGIEAGFESWLKRLEQLGAHLPSRVRSLLWVACAVPVLSRANLPAPRLRDAVDLLIDRLAGVPLSDAAALHEELMAGFAR